MADIYISGLSEPDEMKEIFKETGAGLETITFSQSAYLDELETSIASERELIASYGSPDLSFHGPFLDLNPMTYDSLIYKATMTRFNQCYEAAQVLGAKKIVYHSGMIPTVYFIQGWAERMIAFWKDFLRDKSGIGICMENVLDREYEPLLEVAEGIGHPDFGLCLDIGHAHCYSEHPVTEWADALKGHIRHVHVHDNDGSWDHHRPLGEGTIPYETLLPMIAGQNPGVSWTIECIGRRDVMLTYERLTALLVE